MALLFMDGCDHYGVKADIEDKYDTVEGTTEIAPFNTGGKFGGGYIGISTDDISIRKSVTPSVTMFVQGYFFFSESDAFGTDNLIVAFDEFSGAQWGLVTLSDGRVAALKGGGGGTQGVSTEVLEKGKWLFFELKYVINDLIGEVFFSVDGVTFLDLTDADIKGTSSQNSGEVGFYCPSSALGVDCRWDDIVIMNDSGPANNGLLGAHRIQTLYPDGDGVTTDFTPTGAGTTNADRVDDGDTGPDGDTTYVESATIGHKDLYTLDDLDSANFREGVAVQVGTVVRKDIAGARTSRNLLRTGGTNFDGTIFSPLENEYTLELDLYVENPDTLSTWEIQDINSLEVGQEVVT